MLVYAIRDRTLCFTCVGFLFLFIVTRALFPRLADVVVVVVVPLAVAVAAGGGAGGAAAALFSLSMLLLFGGTAIRPIWVARSVLI